MAFPGFYPGKMALRNTKHLGNFDLGVCSKRSNAVSHFLPVEFMLDRHMFNRHNIGVSKPSLTQLGILFTFALGTKQGAKINR
jgi:hypothetical protein